MARVHPVVIFVLGIFFGMKNVIAHPHIFVEAELDVIFDAENSPEALRISWHCDPLFSTLLVSDMGLGDDYDGILSPDEVVELQGFDMNWRDGYHGDTLVTQQGRPLELGTTGVTMVTAILAGGALWACRAWRILPR